MCKENKDKKEITQEENNETSIYRRKAIEDLMGGIGEALREHYKTVVIPGMCGCGKTSYALALAQGMLTNGEIHVNTDNKEPEPVDIGLGITEKYGIYYVKDTDHEDEYFTLVDALHSGVLDNCGCGRPEDNIKYILGGLKVINKLSKEVHTKKIEYKQWEEEEKSYFGTNGGNYFFYYMMDKLEFTEHGGSVPGWISKKGIKFMELGERALKEENEDTDDTNKAEDKDIEINENNNTEIEK